MLASGPYRVWVRWNKPTKSVEEFRNAIKTQIATLKELNKAAISSLPPGSLERLEKM